MRPLIDDAPTRGLIQTTVKDIAVALAKRERKTALEAADLAVLRSYLAPDILFPDESGDVAGRLAAEAIKRFNGSPALGLFGGAARIGWTLAHLASEDVANDKCARLDHMLERALDSWIGEYDLCSGLVGFGVYALERGDAGRLLAVRVLDHLESTATAHADGIAWHTSPDLLPPSHIERAPDGYWNLGLANGIPGVVALLSRYIAEGIEVARAKVLLDGAVRYLITVEPPPASPEVGRYPTWHPNHKPPSTRLAWCYGDLGVAVALLGAASRAKLPIWREGLALARTCAARTLQQAHIHDAGICHGAAGVAHLFHRMARATGDEQLYLAARAWIVEVLRMRSNVAIAGYPRVFESGGELRFEEDATLLTGCVGVALVLHAAISEEEPRWDRLLLVDLPEKP